MDILSMTGYGSAKGTVEGLNISAELKSVNNRYLDVSVRLPRGFLFAEEAIKAAVQQHISRGKVDVFLTVDSSQAADTVVRVNEPLLRAYLDALDSIATEHGLHNDVTALSVARFPDVLSVEKAEADQDALLHSLSCFRHLRQSHPVHHLCPQYLLVPEAKEQGLHPVCNHTLNKLLFHLNHMPKNDQVQEYSCPNKNRCSDYIYVVCTPAEYMSGQ